MTGTRTLDDGLTLRVLRNIRAPAALYPVKTVSTTLPRQRSSRRAGEAKLIKIPEVSVIRMQGSRQG